VKAPPADQYLHDNSMFEDTESALAISPCPQVDGTSEIRDGTQSASQHSARHVSTRMNWSKPSPWAGQSPWPSQWRWWSTPPAGVKDRLRQKRAQAALLLVPAMRARAGSKSS